MKKIMITGAAGFLGRNLTKMYSDLGYELVLIDYSDIFHTDLSTGFVYGHSVYNLDIRTEQAAIMRLLKDVDCVIHCANRARIDPSWTQYADYYNTNITATHDLFRLCQIEKVKKFVYISSSSVYGNTSKAVQEEHDPLIPTNPYAVSKMAAEWALQAQAQTGDTTLLIVRPFTMYGNDMSTGPHGLVIAKFLTAMLGGEPLIVHDHGNQTRDFIHIDDAVQGIRLLIDNGIHKEVYNLGSGQSISIKSLADIVSTQQIMTAARIGPVKSTCASISKLRKFGFDPKVKVIEWLTERTKELKLKHSNNKETQ